MIILNAIASERCVGTKTKQMENYDANEFLKFSDEVCMWNQRHHVVCMFSPISVEKCFVEEFFDTLYYRLALHNGAADSAAKRW